ncbi:MAG: hypothetical protein AAFR93_03095, partial [Pseudomonadota bacterium]
MTDPTAPLWQPDPIWALIVVLAVAFWLVSGLELPSARSARRPQPAPRSAPRSDRAARAVRW